MKTFIKTTVSIISGLLFLTFTIHNSAFSQNVGINASGATPNASAMLDVASTTSGMLIPRMTTVQRDAIASPANSLIVFNTDCNCMQIYNSIQLLWENFYCFTGCSSAPTTPGIITGNNTTCTNATGVTYSIAQVAGATSYTWTVPSGANIIAGQGTTGIIVNFGNSSGNISVTASNNCGISSASTLAITVNALPSAAGAISGSISVCQNQTGVSYSVPAIANATSYIWAYSGTGAIFSGSTNSITIDFSSSATSGNLTVTGTNTCGNGTGSAIYPIGVSKSNFICAIGGTITLDGNYKVHTFTSSGTFQINSAPVGATVDYLVVAGGGGGGTAGGCPTGGGGAGGLLTGTAYSVTVQSYAITIGSGGTNNNNGGNSIFSTVTAIGGGRGGSTGCPAVAGAGGGSGGGGARTSYGGGNVSGGAGTAGQGNNGGSGYYDSGWNGLSSGGGGGGGAGSTGGNGTSTAGGSGGIGVLSSITGTATYYAGGGGSYPGGSGGNGGGGAAYVNGTANTGGGGGTGAVGGSGVVIIRYQFQ